MAYTIDSPQWQAMNSLCASRHRPFYFYDLEDALTRALAYLKSGARVHYAMKANSNSRLLRSFAQAGLGVDVVSLGEMQKALAHGFKPKNIIFSGVGKDREDLESALQNEILQVNVESFEELQHLEAICQSRRRRIDVALRLNILLEAPTHKHVQTANPDSKFGLDMRQLPQVLDWWRAGARHAELKGLTVHIGSQIMDLDVFRRMSLEMARLYGEVKAEGFPLARLDLGGGFGIDYQTDGADDMERLASYFAAVLPPHQGGPEIIFEPGRFLVARMGVLMSKVIYVKKAPEREFVILNAGMNSLMRPALYQSYHRIVPMKPRSGPLKNYKVVGPLCESTDTFAESRALSPLESGDWVGIFDAGAYGAVMANTYNESQMPEQWSWLHGQLEVEV